MHFTIITTVTVVILIEFILFYFYFIFITNFSKKNQNKTHGVTGRRATDTAMHNELAS